MKKIKIKRENMILSFILILAAILNFANLKIEGYANEYYAAGVKSMTMSLKNFFFVSFDPSGFVSIDKPPLGFWLQAISAKIFGFSGWSIILPQALAGVVSVGLIYFIVKRSFGSKAGLISALCLAITPVFVAASRNNTIDNLLVMTLLFASLALSKAAEKGKLKYLILSFFLIGLGFNIKMLQAYMILPAIYITYIISSLLPVKKRISHLFIGTIILLLVSLSWAIAVDLVPASNRPYVGSSTNNTVMELIIGHNGLERLGIGGTNNDKRNFENSSSDQNLIKMPPQYGNYIKDIHQQISGNIRGGMGGGFGGQEKASIIRLFSKNSLSDQISWFLPLAVFGFLAAALKEKLKNPFDNEKKLALVFWVMWLLPEFVYFSFTKGLFHPYYLTMLAPPIAALTGIGLISMWQFYKEKESGWKSYLLPIALIADGLVQILILSYYYDSTNVAKILSLIVAILCFISSIMLIVMNTKDKEIIPKISNEKLKKILISIALISIFAAPAFYSSTAIFYKMQGNFPSAGLSLISSKQVNIPSKDNSTDKLIKFLQANRKNEKYLVAVPSATDYASSIIIETGEPVMALGGFSGTDNIITLNEFKKLVSEGAIRYAIISGDGRGANSEIINWIKENGKLIPESEWSGSNTFQSQSQYKYGNPMNRMDFMELYDLKEQ